MASEPLKESPRNSASIAAKCAKPSLTRCPENENIQSGNDPGSDAVQDALPEGTPDPDDDATGLFVLSLRTLLPPQEAMPRLDAFDETWWLDASRAVNGRIVVAIEFL